MMCLWYRRDWKEWKQKREYFLGYIEYLQKKLDGVAPIETTNKIHNVRDVVKMAYNGESDFIAPPKTDSEKKYCWNIRIMESGGCIEGYRSQNILSIEDDGTERYFTEDEVSKLNAMVEDNYKFFKFNVNETASSRTRKLNEIRTSLISKL